jgi:hypothetical protein
MRERGGPLRDAKILVRFLYDDLGYSKRQISRITKVSGTVLDSILYGLSVPKGKTLRSIRRRIINHLKSIKQSLKVLEEKYDIDLGDDR